MTHDHFPSSWLAMREPVDHESRALALLPLLKVAWHAGRWSRVLDLASGSGSNLRYLAPRLPSDQEWTLVDHDAELLGRARASGRVRRVTRVHGDLNREGLAAVADAHLVTGSAMLDLVSDRWLQTLADACRTAECGVLIAMTYDGWVEWDEKSRDPIDPLVRDLVNRHQRRDKGLGVALGPTAPVAAETVFRRAGYRVWFRPSPWRLAAPHRPLVRSLVDGWHRAASEQEPTEAQTLADWRVRRQALVAGGEFGLSVGHVDMLALRPDRV